ncbi:hypothetical protein GEMRC1_003799 [Eukaryota sp. GEM-RC1]
MRQLSILLLFIGLSFCARYTVTIHNDNRRAELRLNSKVVEQGYWIDQPPRTIFPKETARMVFDGDLATIRYIEKGLFRDKSITMEVGYADLSRGYCACRGSGKSIFNNLCYSCSLCETFERVSSTSVLFVINTWF